MKINKVNNKTIIIALTEEELYFDYDINVEDLVNLNSRPKISQTIMEIIKKAAKETNMEIAGGIRINIKINDLNEVEIEVIFENQFNENNLQGIAKFLKSIIDKTPEAEVMLNEVFAKMKLTPEAVNKVKELMSNMNDEEYIFEKENIEKNEALRYVYIANKLEHLITIAPIINNFVKYSTIYKLNDKYYLEMNIFENKDNFIINIMNEFMLKRNDNILTAYLMEHGKILIKNDAIKKLCEL